MATGSEVRAGLQGKRGRRTQGKKVLRAIKGGRKSKKSVAADKVWLAGRQSRGKASAATRRMDVRSGGIMRRQGLSSSKRRTTVAPPVYVPWWGSEKGDT